MASGMEKRNGAWTSQTRADDARAIRRLAEEIELLSSEPEVRVRATNIRRLARDLEGDL